MPPEYNVTVGATGASGAIFTRYLLLALEDDDRVTEVNFIASDNALRVFAEELGIQGRSNLVAQVLGRELAGGTKIRLQNNADIGACVASGSYPAQAMIVLPCSAGTLARIAHGSSTRLIERAADVCLKERRSLVLCLRETPLNRIHIHNMEIAHDAGATIYPLMPTFYDRPQSLDDLARQFAGRVLAHIGLKQAGMYEWTGQ